MRRGGGGGGEEDPKTLNPKPSTLNPEPQTLNPKPKTLKVRVSRGNSVHGQLHGRQHRLFDAIGDGRCEGSGFRV